MLQDLLHHLAQLQTNSITEPAQHAISWWNQWDSGTVGSSAAAIALGIIWYFARIIRKVVGLLFMTCVIYLTLRYACGIDLLPLLFPEA